MIELVIDGSFEAINLSVFSDRELIYDLFVNSANSHSKLLIHLIDSMLKSLSMDLRQIDEFYCCIGCGKYTSLRVTLATVKGLLFGWRKTLKVFTLPDLIAAATQNLERFRVVCQTSRTAACYADYIRQDGRLTRIGEIKKQDLQEAENTGLPVITRARESVTKHLFRLPDEFIKQVDLMDLKPLY